MKWNDAYNAMQSESMYFIMHSTELTLVPLRLVDVNIKPNLWPVWVSIFC